MTKKKSVERKDKMVSEEKVKMESTKSGSSRKRSRDSKVTAEDVKKSIKKFEQVSRMDKEMTACEKVAQWLRKLTVEDLAYERTAREEAYVYEQNTLV